MSDKGMVHIQGRTEHHFSMKLRMAGYLKLIIYFWKFTFNVSGLYLTMESKTSDECLLYSLENNCHFTEV